MTAPNSNWIQYRRTLTDAYRQRPPIQYVVSDLFALPSLNMVYGAPGCLKSMLMADLGVCVASGAPWLEVAAHNLGLPGQPLPRPVIQAPVLWLDFDNGVNRTDNRLEAIGKARKLSPSIPLAYYSMPQPPLDASKTGSVMALIDLINIENARLVVIDNLATISGGKDENSSEMVVIMNNLRMVAERTGAAVVVIHHARKENGFKGKMGDSLRGFSGIRGAIDTGLLVEREPHSDQVTIKSEKTRDVDIPDFAAEFSYLHKTGSKDLAEARFFGVKIDTGTSNAEIEDAIIDVLTSLQPGQSISQIRLATAAKQFIPDVGLVRIKGMISTLHLAGKIKGQSGKRGSIEYTL